MVAIAYSAHNSEAQNPPINSAGRHIATLVASLASAMRWSRDHMRVAACLSYYYSLTMPVWLHVTLNFAVWKYGSMEEVKDGRMEEVKDSRMEVALNGWDSHLYNPLSLRETRDFTRDVGWEKNDCLVTMHTSDHRRSVWYKN